MLCKGRSTHHKEIIGDCYEADKFNNSTHLAPLLHPLAMLCYIHWPSWELWNHMAVHAEDTVIELLNMAIEIIDLHWFTQFTHEKWWFMVICHGFLLVYQGQSIHVLPIAAIACKSSRASSDSPRFRRATARRKWAWKQLPGWGWFIPPISGDLGMFHTHTYVYIGFKHIYIIYNIYIIGSGDVI